MPKRNRRPSQAVKQVQNRYDAGGQGRRLAGWVTPSSGPNKAITGLQNIRNRTRDLVRNDWSGASQVRVWTTNIVGTGIIPRPKTKVKALKEKLQKLWTSWVEVADADGVLDFYGLMALVVRTWFMAGEVFIRMRPRRLSDGLPVPLQVQVLEPEMVPLFDANSFPNLPAGNKIRQGIELDYIGRRVAYWFYREHPGDAHGSASVSDLVRVPAETVCHIFEPLRPGQLRGVSELASVVTRMRNVGDFDDAVLERQRLANLFTMFVIRPTPSSANDPMTGLPAHGSLDAPLAGLEPGISQELLPGEDVKFSDPPDAGAAYADFMRVQHMGAAAGTGTPYELASGDIENVSDRTLRIVINEFRRLCQQRQWLVFIPQMCKPIRKAWATHAVLSGALTESELADAVDVEWAPQGWAYIHPVQDVQAKQLEVESGFRSRSSVIAERGDDPDQVDIERADEKKRAEDLGLDAAPAPAAGQDQNTNQPQ